MEQLSMRILGFRRFTTPAEALVPDKAPLLGEAGEAPPRMPTLVRAQKLELSATSDTAPQELYELPAGYRTERVLAEIVEIPVEIKPDGWFVPDFRKIERDDVYYSFTLKGDLHLVRKIGDKVRVFEALRTEGGIVALPIFELPL